LRRGGATLGVDLIQKPGRALNLLLDGSNLIMRPVLAGFQENTQIRSAEADVA
jgi:hypothetical protein